MHLLCGLFLTRANSEHRDINVKPFVPYLEDRYLLMGVGIVVDFSLDSVDPEALLVEPPMPLLQQAPHGASVFFLKKTEVGQHTHALSHTYTHVSY